MGSICKKCFKTRDTPHNNSESNYKGFLKDDNSETISNILSVDSGNTNIAHLNDFKPLKVLGKGSFGKVVLVRFVKNNKLFAMKILKKSILEKKKQIAHTMTERIILENINNKFIVKLHYAGQDKEQLYFITEFLQGGEGFFHLSKKPIYKNKEVLFYICECICAIEYMHNNKYIYRDLKPENIGIDTNGHIKLTDFGGSKILRDEDEKAYTMCGTPEYGAPEIIFEKGYDRTCDWFSLGVGGYEMLTGTHPFKHGNNIELSNYTRPGDFPKSMSKDAKDLCRKLLEGNPRKRLGYNGADEIKKHNYFNGVNFDDVNNLKGKPPFIPKGANEYDGRYFDIEFTNEKVNSGGENKLFEEGSLHMDEFEGFTYQPSEI